MGVTRSEGMDIARRAAWTELGRRNHTTLLFGGAIVKLVGAGLVAAAVLWGWITIPHLVLAVVTAGLAAVLFAVAAFRSLSLSPSAVAGRASAKRAGVTTAMLLSAGLLLAAAAAGAALAS